MADKKAKRKKRAPKVTNLAELSAPQPEHTNQRAPTLSLQQEMFCQYFVSETEFYGNGVQSYSRAFDEPINAFNYDAIKTRAARLLMNTQVLKRIEELLSEGGFNDVNVDKHLQFLITQKVDMRSSLGAIKEYNVLKQRVKRGLEIEAPIIGIRITDAPTREQLHAPAQVIHEQENDKQ